MSLLPSEASFAELVQECFAIYRARGVSLSALDTELVFAWAKADIPFEVIARGIRAAALKNSWDAVPGEGPLRSLSQARRQVRAEIQKYMKLSLGARTQTSAGHEKLASKRARRLGANIRRASKASPCLVGVLEALARAPVPRSLEACARHEDLALALALRVLPLQKRIELEKHARWEADQLHRSPSASRLQKIRFYRAVAVRSQFDLATFW